MTDKRLSLRLLAATVLALACPSQAKAHCEVGERTFVATLTFDDPCVTDELSLPTIQSFKNGNEPSAQELDISGEYTKTITRGFAARPASVWALKSANKQTNGN